MKYMIIIFFLLCCQEVFSQQQDSEYLNEQQLEDLAEADEAETEDEYDLQLLLSYKHNPININNPSSSLEEFPLLNPLLVNNLVNYRSLLGDFINIYELQAVPGFTIEIIKKILPYITVAETSASIQSLKQRFQNGEHTLITRPTFPSKNYFRYKYQYLDLLQYGAVGERDNGEKYLLDFYSFHLFIRKMGILKSLAAGDFTVNMGQGLIHWQSQAFRKSSSVLHVKRQSEIIRPYHSAGEYNFHRGAAATFKKYNWEATVFVSNRKLSANVSHDEQYGEVITSINTSGLHRTEKEIEDKNRLQLVTYGANIKYSKPNAHIGINTVQYFYSIPVLKRDEPYNFFAVKGKQWSNFSTDYSYTFRNYHLFGEIALDRYGHQAFINGVLSSLHHSLDISIIHRAIAKTYQSIYGNAFTENTMPSNETGLYMGISYKPHHHWKMEMYADVFSFPWLKYRIDAPAYGAQQLLQLNWKPGKHVEAYTRFRVKSKPLNMEGLRLNYPDNRVIRNWRTHVSFQVNRSLILRSRIEFCWFQQPETEIPETGYLFYTDLVYKPLGKWYSGNLRFQVFECDTYDARIYAYENDLLFTSSTPAYFEKGCRAYINVRAKPKLPFAPGIMLDIGLKAAITVYQLSADLVSAPPKPARSEFKLQLFLTRDGKNL